MTIVIARGPNDRNGNPRRAYLVIDGPAPIRAYVDHGAGISSVPNYKDATATIDMDVTASGWRQTIQAYGDWTQMGQR